MQRRSSYAATAMHRDTNLETTIDVAKFSYLYRGDLIGYCSKAASRVSSSSTRWLSKAS
jgi:hypothetical protein